ncbi:MAG: cyclase family protein [Bacteroidota bacterium]
MITTILYNGITYQVDFSRPLDISMPLRGDSRNVGAWYLDHPTIEPHKERDFIAKVSEGASINFNSIWFNPHAHGTHTECLGHITEDFHSVNKALKSYFFAAELITIAPEKRGTDFVISKRQLQYVLGEGQRQAVIIRTLPNTRAKLSRQYSHTNPPYLLEEAAQFLCTIGVQHLLIDLPSVDKEKDNGALLAHRAFWDLGGEPRKQATITEFIYVANTIADGKYFLNLQVAPFENDAAPSRPVLFKAKEV